MNTTNTKDKKNLIKQILRARPNCFLLHQSSLTSNYVKECLLSLAIHERIFYFTSGIITYNGDVFPSIGALLNNSDIITNIEKQDTFSKLSIYQYIKRDPFLDTIQYSPLEQQQTIIKNVILQTIVNDLTIDSKIFFKDNKFHFIESEILKLCENNLLLQRYYRMYSIITSGIRAIDHITKIYTQSVLLVSPIFP